LLEGLLAIGVVYVLGAAVAAAVFVPWSTLLPFGFAGIALGLLLGVPTGFVYHVKLRAALLAQGDLPRRWWVRPFELHERLAEPELRRMRPWFMLGGAGFLLCVLGIAGATLGVIALALR
jgi:hypothetical protein